MLIKKYIFKELDFDKKHKVEDIINNKVKHLNLEISRIILVFNELYTNAYKYGGKLPNVKIKIYNSFIVLRIDDFGPGFDYLKKINESEEEILKNILRESGRGIHIVEKMTSRFLYNKKGNSVLVQIKENLL